MSLVQAIGLASVLGGFENMLDQMEGDVVYLVGTNVEYAIYLEFGTSKMEAYPWLGPATAEFKSNPSAFVDVDDANSSGELVTKIALALERRATQNATAGGGNRSPGTHPTHPKRQTGNLAGSIEAVRVR